MLNFILQKLISEVPNWVKKEKENLLGYYQIMSLDKKKREYLEISLKIEKYNNTIKELEQEKKIQNDKINLFEKNFNLINKEIYFKEKKIEEYNEIFEEIKTNQKNNSQKNKRNSITRMNVYDTPKIKKLLEYKIDNYNIMHNCITDNDSFGSPILNCHKCFRPNNPLPLKSVKGSLP